MFLFQLRHISSCPLIFKSIPSQISTLFIYYHNKNQTLNHLSLKYTHVLHLADHLPRTHPKMRILKIETKNPHAIFKSANSVCKLDPIFHPSMSVERVEFKCLNYERESIVSGEF